MKERIIELRTKFNLTQKEFGRKISIDRGVIHRIESGVLKPSDKVVKAICDTGWDGKTVSESWLRDGLGAMFIQCAADPEKIVKEDTAISTVFHPELMGVSGTEKSTAMTAGPFSELKNEQKSEVSGTTKKKKAVKVQETSKPDLEKPDERVISEHEEKLASKLTTDPVLDRTDLISDPVLARSDPVSNPAPNELEEEKPVLNKPDPENEPDLDESEEKPAAKKSAMLKAMTNMTMLETGFKGLDCINAENFEIFSAIKQVVFDTEQELLHTCFDTDLSDSTNREDICNTINTALYVAQSKIRQIVEVQCKENSDLERYAMANKLQISDDKYDALLKNSTIINGEDATPVICGIKVMMELTSLAQEQQDFINN